MAGGRGAGSFCRDRGRAEVGKEGEKLSNITHKTLLSEEENDVRALVDVCACLSAEALWLRVELAGLRVSVKLFGSSAVQTGRWGFLARWPPRGALLAWLRQPAWMPGCLTSRLQTLDESHRARCSWMSTGSKSKHQIPGQHTSAGNVVPSRMVKTNIEKHLYMLLICYLGGQ